MARTIREPLRALQERLPRLRRGPVRSIPLAVQRSRLPDTGFRDLLRRNDRRRAATHCRQRRPETLANIVQATCPSALPTGFCYAYGCSKLRPDEFGGGFVLITDDAVVFRGTQEGLHSALKQLEDEDARSLVLATRDPKHGLSFWNKETGFGRLADATVFTPSEAEKAAPVIAADEPEWTTMPRWPQ